MTIKTTLAYGKSFHFYQEGLDNNYVYLELEDVPYDVGYRRLMVAIPIDIWEVIRLLASARLDLIDASDSDLMKQVEGGVDERIAIYVKARNTDPEKADILRFENSVIYGAADDDRDHQIMRGIEYYRTERDRQRGVVERMSQHKIINIGSILP